MEEEVKADPLPFWSMFGQFFNVSKTVQKDIGLMHLEMIFQAHPIVFLCLFEPVVKKWKIWPK